MLGLTAFLKNRAIAICRRKISIHANVSVAEIIINQCQSKPYILSSGGFRGKPGGAMAPGPALLVIQKGPRV